jgi:hypothetical protein
LTIGTPTSDSSVTMTNGRWCCRSPGKTPRVADCRSLTRFGSSNSPGYDRGSGGSTSGYRSVHQPRVASRSPGWIGGVRAVITAGPHVNTAKVPETRLATGPARNRRLRIVEPSPAFVRPTASISQSVPMIRPDSIWNRL